MNDDDEDGCYEGQLLVDLRSVLKEGAQGVGNYVF